MVVTSSQEFSTKQILLVHWLYQHKSTHSPARILREPTEDRPLLFPPPPSPSLGSPSSGSPSSGSCSSCSASPASRSYASLSSSRHPPSNPGFSKTRAWAGTRVCYRRGPKGTLRYPRQCACVCLFVCECLCAYRCAYLCVIVWERERDVCLPRGLTLCRTPVILNGFLSARAQP